MDQEGLLTSTGPGEVTIIVRTEDGGFEDACTLKVLPVFIPVSGISITNCISELEIDSSYHLRAMITPEDASDTTLSWESSNSAVLAVDASSGMVTAISPGEATLSVRTNDGNKSADCLIRSKNATSAAEEIFPNMQVRIHPNPVSKTLNIRFACRDTQRRVNVYSSGGQLAYHEKAAGLSKSIPVESLQLKGIGMLQIITKEGISGHKILIR